MTVRCCSMRRARISAYAISSSTPDSAFRLALTAGRSWIDIVCRATLSGSPGEPERLALQLVSDHDDPEKRQIRDRAEEQRARGDVAARRGEARRQGEQRRP